MRKMKWKIIKNEKNNRWLQIVCIILLIVIQIGILGCNAREMVEDNTDSEVSDVTTIRQVEELDATVSKEKENEMEVTTEFITDSKPDVIYSNSELKKLDKVNKEKFFLCSIRNFDINYYAQDVTGWAIIINAGNNYNLENIRYLNGFSGYLEEIDVDLSYQLQDGMLVITPKGYLFKDEEIIQVEDIVQSEEIRIEDFSVIDFWETIYVAIAAEEVSCSEVYVKYGENTIKSEFAWKELSGDIVFVDSIGKFSEELCWVNIGYIDTGYSYPAIIDKEGNIKAEFREGGFKEYGEFQNGVSLVTTYEGVKQFIDENGNIVFASDDEEYGSMVKGMYDGGYVYLEKTEVSFDAIRNYVSLITVQREFIREWEEVTDRSGYYFSYLGNGVFTRVKDLYKNTSVWFIDEETGNVTYIDEYKNGIHCDGIEINSLANQPEYVLDNCDGWIVVDDDDRMYSNTIIVHAKSGKIYNLGTFYDTHRHSIYSDDSIVMLGLDNDDKIVRLGIFDTKEEIYTSIDYPYLEQIYEPETIFTPYINTSIGVMPAYNVQIDFDSIPLKSGTEYIDLRYSKGALLLSLEGKDKAEYFALIDKKGNHILEPTKGQAVGTMGEGRFVVKFYSEEEQIYSVINEKGETDFWNFDSEKLGTIIDFEEYSDGLAYIETTLGSYFIDVDGNVIIGSEPLNK